MDVLFDAAGEDDSESEESKTEAKTTSAADYIWLDVIIFISIKIVQFKFFN